MSGAWLPLFGLELRESGSAQLGWSFDQFHPVGVCSIFIISAYVVLFMQRESRVLLGELSGL